MIDKRSKAASSPAQRTLIMKDSLSASVEDKRFHHLLHFAVLFFVFVFILTYFYDFSFFVMVLSLFYLFFQLILIFYS